MLWFYLILYMITVRMVLVMHEWMDVFLKFLLYIILKKVRHQQLFFLEPRIKQHLSLHLNPMKRK